jgi:hypothetical protein
MRFALLSLVSGFLVGAAPAVACTPGGLLCPPSDAVVRDYLAMRYGQRIAVRDLTFSIRPFGRPEDKTQRFRVEFRGKATAVEDLMDDASAEEVLAACRLPPDTVRSEPRNFYMVRIVKGAEVSFTGDTAMRGEDGKWVGSADLLTLRNPDGAMVFGLPAGSLRAKPAILGQPSGDAACADLRGRR